MEIHLYHLSHPACIPSGAPSLLESARYLFYGFSAEHFKSGQSVSCHTSGQPPLVSLNFFRKDSIIFIQASHHSGGKSVFLKKKKKLKKTKKNIFTIQTENTWISCCLEASLRCINQRGPRNFLCVGVCSPFLALQ